MSNLSPEAVERCKLLRYALMAGPMTRKELKAETRMSSNDLKSAMRRCWGARMTVRIDLEGEPAKYALTQFGYRVALRDEKSDDERNTHAV